MASNTINSYDGTWGQNVKASVDAPSMEVAARVLALQRGSDPQLLQRVKEGIFIELPILDVAFYGEISDDAARTAGCKVFPRRYSVPGGSKQIFSCYLVSGWKFVKWQIEGEDVMGPDGITPIADPVAELTIPPSPVPIKITAVVSLN